jgi:phosphoribosylamine-glycine ligase
VIKASGPAAGKGVELLEMKEEALLALDEIMRRREFGATGEEVVIEEFSDGDEWSILLVMG